MIVSVIYYKNNNPVIHINKNKVDNIQYVYEFNKHKMGSFDITNKINKDDINSIVGALNSGRLQPDKNEIGTYTLEHIEISVLGDRLYDIYKQKDDIFTVMYTIDITSNNPKDFKQTTINSQVLQNYFIKFKEISKNLTPINVWDINKTTK